jgi:hypothetical protein
VVRQQRLAFNEHDGASCRKGSRNRYSGDATADDYDIRVHERQSFGAAMNLT